MSESLASVLRTVDNIRSAWELGNSQMVAADAAKLAAQLSAGIAVESALRTYSALDGLGRTLSLWRLDMAIAGRSIAGHQALSGVIAGEAVGQLIDAVRDLNLGSRAYDLLHPEGGGGTGGGTGGGDGGGSGGGTGGGTGGGAGGSGGGGGASGGTGGAGGGDGGGSGGGTGGGTGGGAGGSGGGGGASGGTGGAGGGAGAGGTTPPRRDPLVLDLDSDGIETTSTRDSTVILFDHDADGVKTGTGWVKPDDGWLVLDRNGNGTIDSGRELFGVDTLKSNGQFATDGFDALKDLDVNNDGMITVIDSVFANLRIWRDLNQDAISQANELTTLAVNSITGIGVNASAVNTDLGNGNVQTAAGTFTRSNGTTGATGETNGAAANLDLLVNTFYRTFTTQIALTDQAKALPTLRGSGRVRDLNEAISLSTDLGNWVQTYTQQTTRQGQIDRLDGFIERWANTADLKPLKVQADALTGSGVKLSYSLEGLTAGTTAYDDFVRKLGVVERFMGFTYGGANGQARFTPLDATSGNLTVSLAAEQIDSISLAYDRFKTDVYESLLLHTRLRGYFEKPQFAMVDGGFTLDFVPLEAAFMQAIAANPRDGIIDLVEFLSAAGETRLQNLGWNGTGFLITQFNAAPDLGAFSEELSSWTVRFAASTEHNLTGTSRPDLLVGTAGEDTIRVGDGNDIILAKGGDDVIDGGEGDDVIDGGIGNDLLIGGLGNNTYLFGRGDGQDYLQGYDRYTADATPTKINTLQFKAGLLPKELMLKQVHDGWFGGAAGLEVSIAGTTDKITISGFFLNNDQLSPHNPIQQFRFSNGAIWNMADILSKLFAGTADADTINGTIGNDTINGAAGNDNIAGGYGDDILRGGADHDALNGQDGNDTLDGGIGNDLLIGGLGNNTYLFGRGDGQDYLQGYDRYTADATPTKINTLQFKAGLLPKELMLKQVHDGWFGGAAGLEVSIAGTTDKITISGFFLNNDQLSPHNPIQQFRFSNGAIWNMADILSNLS
jgi:hypothetical protein